MPQDHFISCVDEAGATPSWVHTTPALMLNPKAHPLVLMCSTEARLKRLLNAMEAHVHITDTSCVPDGESLQLAISSLYYQAQEIHQLVLGCIERVDEALRPERTGEGES